MAVIVCQAAQEFVKGLSEKFPEYEFTIKPGKKFEKIFIKNRAYDGSGRIYAFIDVESGGVMKPAGLTAPAKGIRFTSIPEAIAASDPYGSFLYSR